ncbi:hypothetical protein Rs2_23601 [Raphanus sativus]|nr:hypothetical protein Rs2_23601 [Raphanus sativus]
MWVEIICGLIYKFVRRLFHDDELSDDETSGSTAIFSVGHRVEKVYGGKAYVGLRIPDADTSSRQDIDLVLLTKGQVVVINVKDLSGVVMVTSDGSWFVNLESIRLTLILWLRGLTLLEGNLSCKVVIPNPNFRTMHAFPSEVITYEEWKHMKPVSRNILSGWVKGALCTGKEMHESSHRKLNFILGTAPMWDRVELKSSKIVFGEFLEFKGKREDTLALKQIKRSKVDRISIQHTSMFGFAPSRLQVVYSYRDYRSEGRSGSESKEVTVRSCTEVVFQPRDSTKIKKFQLSSLRSISLSA